MACFRIKPHWVMKRIRGVAFLSVLLCAGLLTSCELLDGSGRAYSSLETTEWILVRLNGDNLIAQTNITLAFDDGTAGGYAGCNWYGGAYTATGRPLSFTDVAQTERLCLEPPGIMEQESRYLDAFAQVRSYRVVEGRLELSTAAGTTRLVYERREELPMDPRDLVGTYWGLQAWNGAPPLENTTFTLAFQNGTAGGYAGCRNFVATYEAEGDDLRFTSLSMTTTTASCTPDQWEQEGRYTTSLSETHHYRLREDELELLTPGGEVLRFSRVLIR